MVDLGLGTASQRFIPEYTERKSYDLLRGFLSSGRWLASIIAIVVAAAGALGVMVLSPYLDTETIVPLYLACGALPIYGLVQVQSGVASALRPGAAHFARSVVAPFDFALDPVQAKHFRKCFGISPPPLDRMGVYLCVHHTSV